MKDLPNGWDLFDVKGIGDDDWLFWLSSMIRRPFDGVPTSRLFEIA